MSKTQKFEVGNQVYVKTSGGHADTMYEITKLLPGGGCLIREYSSTKTYAEQRFDTSMLVHAVTDTMLNAFSFGSLRAGRRTK